ncbi:hypothetical protein LVQ79_12855 [Buttiauxella sp. A2-C1_F]|uniref:hypothetical protein n=1 Tax=Buttiauxella sp. A2-C1_F TaxID=2904526 RepID=UPI001E55B585|nr:hypothetical protein [Buttiauxella sp. A2-C1_F]MCE0846442.1 hypothetical protein [Buttiauxella sp. A2-C1_F]
MKKIIFTIILFMYIFSFKLPLINSTFYAAVISSVFLIFSTKNINLVAVKIAVNKFSMYIIYPLSLFTVIAACISLLHASSDLSYSFSLLKVVLYAVSFIPIVILYYAWLGHGNNDISKIVYNVFFIQSLIIISCLINPMLREFVGYFQFEDAVAVSERYNGIRGLALAGPQFFALACSYIFVFIFIAHDFVHGKLSLKYVSITIPIMLLATFSIGRTALLGAVVYFLIAVTSKINKLAINIKVIKSLFIYLFLFGVGILYVMFNPALSELLFNNLIPFAFEFIIKYLDTGTASTTSTDILQNMYFPISDYTFLLGDGMYSAVNGVGYYMGTDAGYMRPILFGGVFFFLMLAMHWLFSFCYGLGVIYGRYISFIILVVTLILQYKGEVIAVQPTIIATLLPFLLLARKGPK